MLQVLYLLFNEGYTAMSGPALVRPDLTAEAVRLTRELLRLVPDDGEVAGLLALMLLVDARRPARTGPDGALVPLAEQDRTRWDRPAIAEGIALVTASLATKPLGPYQLQAAIAAIHDEAPTAQDTDWPQILALYRLLERMVPGPTVTLNRAVAEAMVHGPRAGLDLLATLTVDNRVSGAHRFDAVRAHLLEMAGEHRRGLRDLPAGRPPDRQHPRTPLPAHPRQARRSGDDRTVAHGRSGGLRPSPDGYTSGVHAPARTMPARHVRHDHDRDRVLAYGAVRVDPRGLTIGIESIGRCQ